MYYFFLFLFFETARNSRLSFEFEGRAMNLYFKRLIKKEKKKTILSDDSTSAHFERVFLRPGNAVLV